MYDVTTYSQKINACLPPPPDQPELYVAAPAPVMELAAPPVLASAPVLSSAPSLAAPATLTAQPIGQPVMAADPAPTPEPSDKEKAAKKKKKDKVCQAFIMCLQYIILITLLYFLLS